MRYCDVHRNLLQLMLHHGFMSEAEMLAQCRACVEAHAQDAKANKVNVSGSDEAQLEKARKILLEEISPELEPLGMKVAQKKLQGVLYYGVVNLRDDEAGVGSSLGKPQREFFHMLVAAIKASEGKAVDATDAQNVRLDLKGGKMSMDETEDCLEQLSAGGWLAKTEEGHYSLGIRSELQELYPIQRAAAPAADVSG